MSIVFDSRFDRAVRSQPFLPSTLQDSHALESAGLENLRRRDARFIFRARAVGDDLSIFRKIFQRWIREPRLYLRSLK